MTALLQAVQAEASEAKATAEGDLAGSTKVRGGGVAGCGWWLDVAGGKLGTEIGYNFFLGTEIWRDWGSGRRAGDVKVRLVDS